MKKCCKCEEYLDPNNSWWDDSGYSYSTQLTKCSKCGTINILGYYDYPHQNVNWDLRYYEYVKRKGRD